MELFLPTAHMDINLLLILVFGGAVGFLSGLVGVGGGFLITPLLIFIGVPPLLAVGTGAAQIAGASAGGTYAHWRLGNVDMRMGMVLLLGSWTGGALGVLLVRALEKGGHFGNTVTFLYVGLLGFIGATMLFESLRAMVGSRKKVVVAHSSAGNGASWMQALPLQTDFPVSGLRLSLLVPVALGTAVGVLTSLMGVGGGFVMVPVMIYMLRMPTKVVVGTSLFQLLFTTAEVSILQAGVNHAVDPFLALALMLGSAFGTQWGARLGTKLSGEKLRLILALVVVSVAIKMLTGILLKPDEIFILALTR